MNFYYLLCEAVIDLISCVLGVVLIVRAHDNRMRLTWGIVCLTISVVLLYDNLTWLSVHRTVSADLPAHNDLLLLFRMMNWFGLAYIVSLYPLSSLRPGYLTSFRLLISAIPVGIVILVGLCYWFFNGTITQLTSLQAVTDNLDAFDVRLRLAIFVISVFIPPLYFMAPLFGKWKAVHRHTTSRMTAYIVVMFVLLVYYIIFTLFPNDFLFYSFGMVVILFCIFFSALFLLYENPLTKHEKEITPLADEESLADIFYIQIDAYLNENHSFTNPNYTIEELSLALNIRPMLVTEGIKSGGFSGFREYMNYLRIEHFKQLAHTCRTRSIKELMFDCGFVSRSTFYRVFAIYEDMTPMEYIERLYHT